MSCPAHDIGIGHIRYRTLNRSKEHAMKMTENIALLDHKRRVDADRKAAAIARRRQSVLRDITPGTATPATVARFVRPVAKVA